MKFKTNIYWASLYQLILPLLVLWLSRILFYIYNKEIIGEITTENLLSTMGNGLRFDIVPLLYFNAIWIVMRYLPFDFTTTKKYLKVSNVIFIITNTLLLILNFGDIIFIRYNGVRLRFTNLKEVLIDESIGKLLFSYLFEYWEAFFWGATTLIILFRLYNRIEITPASSILKNLKKKNRYICRSAILLITIATMVLGMRGFYISGKAIQISDAARYVKNTNEINVLLNTPFCILGTLSEEKNNVITPQKYFSEAELKEKRNSEFQHSYPSPYNLPKKNVMIICMEGISQFLIDNLSPLDDEYDLHLTPFLDSLSKESLVCTNMYAIGTRTHGGTIAISGGFPEFEPFVYMQSTYIGNKFDSNANLLKEEGYQTCFYSGGKRDAYNIDNFAHIAGFTRIINRNTYNNEDDYDGVWGIYDHKIAEYIVKDLSGIKTPFYSTWLNISSHSPYRTPKDWNLDKYQNKEKGAFRSIEYADLSIRHFFQIASKEPWYNNTIFIITSDHGCRELEANPIYTSPLISYRIPFIVFTPDKSIKPERIEEKVMSQIDINPTILSLLNYNKEHIALGESLFNKKQNNYAINYRLGQYQVIGTKYLVRFSPDGKKIDCLFDIINDIELKRPLKKIQDSTTINHMIDYGRAFIQDYTERILSNKMSIKAN